MPRVALIGVGSGTLTAVEAALDKVELFHCTCGEAAAGSDLHIVDLDTVGRSKAKLEELIELYAPAAPLLLLLDREAAALPDVALGLPYRVVRKPFDLFELRSTVAGLLAERAAATAESPADTDAARAASPAAAPATGIHSGGKAAERGDMATTLSVQELLHYPFVALKDEPLLRAALRLRAPLWLLGEPGTGRRAIAEAVATCAGGEILLWQRGEALAEVLARLSGGCRSAGGGSVPVDTLLVEDIEDRDIDDQERLAGLLSGAAAGPPPFALIATSRSDPAPGVAGGGFSRRLYYELSGLALHLAPLRERPESLTDLIELLSSQICDGLAAATPSFHPGALDRLTSYPWPGNLAELRSVLLRSLSLLCAREAGPAPARLRAEDIHFLPHPARESARFASGQDAASPSLPVGRAARDREWKVGDGDQPGAPLSSAELQGGRHAGPPEAGTETEEAANLIERVVSSLAHDLRNPLQTVTTFAELASAAAAESDDGAELARLAVESCRRVDHHVGRLEAYSRLGEPLACPLNLTALLSAALAARDESLRVRLQAPESGGNEIVADPDHLRLVADLLLDEIEAELGAGGEVVIDYRADDATVKISLPTGGGPAGKLRRLVDGNEEPAWRLLLAAAVARRGGGDLSIEHGQGLLNLQWRLPRAETGDKKWQASR